MQDIKSNNGSKWPKTFPPLTPQQAAISDDFMKYWHETLPRSYGPMDRFGHEYVIKTAPQDFQRTLEIGAGTGGHLKYEKLTQRQKENYYAVDIRENMVEELRKQFPEINAVQGDCQQRMDFEDNYFDRVVAIHVLEHLTNLPATVRELYRLCDKTNGILCIVIPCEGSMAYTLGRRISAQRIFEARYKQSYRWLIEREHVNRPFEIFEEFAPYFTRLSSTYYPFPIAFEFCNLFIGATFKPKQIVVKG